jgi:hypothetical protein
MCASELAIENISNGASGSPSELLNAGPSSVTNLLTFGTLAGAMTSSQHAYDVPAKIIAASI